MRTILAFTLLTFVTSARAENLLQFAVAHGMDAADRWVTAMAEGHVMSYLKDVRDTSAPVEAHLAHLSEAALKAIQQEIDNISDNAQVEDTGPTAPKCSDSPPIHVSIWKNGKEIQIYRFERCHEFKLTDHSGDRLYEIGKAFYDLAGF